MLEYALAEAPMGMSEVDSTGKIVHVTYGKGIEGIPPAEDYVGFDSYKHDIWAKDYLDSTIKERKQNVFLYEAGDRVYLSVLIPYKGDHAISIWTDITSVAWKYTSK